MAQAFAIPNSDSYVGIFESLVSKSDLRFNAAKCVSQCTGCRCSCSKGKEDFDIEW